jgi:hypothetical protein
MKPETKINLWRVTVSTFATEDTPSKGVCHTTFRGDSTHAARVLAQYITKHPSKQVVCNPYK